MIRIRKGIFETNSSSNDSYYDDYDDPIPTDYPITLFICMKANSKDDAEYLIESIDFCDIIEECINILGKDINFIKDTCIHTIDTKFRTSNKESDYIDPIEWDDDILKFNIDVDVEFRNYWTIDNGHYSPQTKYEPEEFEPATFGVFIPVWNDKYTKELEILLKKSKYGKYIDKLHKVSVDINKVQSKVDGLLDGFNVEYYTPSDKLY